MYLEHFGLSESPFSIAPNPHYLFMSSRHRDALAHLLYGVQTDGGFILLTGEVGTGKTTLCRCLLEQIPSDVDLAYVLNPKVTVPELLATICDEFGITYQDDDSAKHLVDQLSQFLLDGHANQRKAVVIIDEAQNLSSEVLEQLRLLTNLETNERKLLQIILLGQPELLDLLARRELRQFSQRITARFHLGPLSLADTKSYISHRLEIAGLNRQVFNNGAVKKIFKLSGGIPRVINLIADRSLLGAYAEDRDMVTPRIVSRAASEVLGSSPVKKKPVAGWMAAAVFAVIAVALGYYGVIENKMIEPTVSKQSEVEGATPLAATSAAVESTGPSPATPESFSTPLQGHPDLTQAYHDLFALWGTAFEDRVTPPCDLALGIGLMCNQRPLTMAALVDLNRPAIVRDDTGYLTVSHIASDNITLIAGSRQYSVPHQEFAARFQGDMNILWRTPPMYDQLLRPLRMNDSGPAVDWLVVLLAMNEGREPPLETGHIFDAAIQTKVIAFQKSVGLPGTGMVGVDTWIHLNSSQPLSTPILASNSDPISTRVNQAN